MAMVRKIQHPGIQIEESEIGGYTRTVVMNNAYIMGFADRGPIYDYSWITTSKEFTKIYGEPQTEAEKYLFTAVQSVLNNGGTPIVARMPYDNKQCQAYKALKMKWMVESDIFTDVKGKEGDANAFNNGQVKNTDSPLVDLEKITEDIDRNRPFSKIVNADSLTINNQIVSGEALESITLDQLVKQLNPYKTGDAKSAGELYDGVSAEFKINGNYPSALNVDQDAIKGIINTISTELVTAERNYYVYNNAGVYQGYIDGKAFKDAKSLEVDGTTGLFGITELFLAVNDHDGKTVGYINLFGTNVEDRNELPVYPASCIPDDITDLLKRTGELQERRLLSAFVVGTQVGRGNKTLTIDAKFDTSKTTFNLEKIAEAITSGYIEQGKTVAYISSNDQISSFWSQVAGETFYNDLPIYSSDPTVNEQALSTFMKPSLFTRTTVSELSSIYLSAEFYDDNNIKKIVLVNDGSYPCNNIVGALSFSGKTNKSTLLYPYLIPIFKGTLNGFELLDGKLDYSVISSQFEINASTGRIVGSKPRLLTDVIFEYGEDVASGKLLGFFYYGTDVNFNEIQDGVVISGINDFKGTTRFDVFTSGNISKLIQENGGVAPFITDNSLLSTYFVGVPEAKVEELTEFISVANNVDSKKYSMYFDTVVEYTESLVMEVTKSLKNFTIEEIDNKIALDQSEEKLEGIPFNMRYPKNSIPRMLQYLKTIYNDSRLIDKSKLNTIRLDAKLLSTPEMGFKVGLYLDSEDTEISNDQYDDLVTVNQFKAVDRTIDKYGRDIDDANFIIVDKQKTVVQGQGGNIGYFATVIDPFDALKVQRTLVNPAEEQLRDDEVYDHSDANRDAIDYWAYESVDSWNQIYENLLDSMDTLQRVRNADGIYIGEPKQSGDEAPNLLDSWSVPLTGGYYEESISKMLMKKFPGISMADIDTDAVTNKESGFVPSIIDHQFGTHIMVAVCKTTIDQATGKIIVTLIETFFGSLFNERNIQNGRTLYIGDIINGNSDYIEFYRNNYVSAGEAGAYDPPEYRRTDVNQIFIKDSEDLRNASELRGVDVDSYGLDSADEEFVKQQYKAYLADLASKHIFVIDKKDVCIYNLHWEANFTSFSKKESQKVIANTANLYSVNDGTTINIAKNFLVDMDRCIKFIKNRDDIPLHFVCDAGLSTIAQFCDNVVWNPNKSTVIGEEIDPATKKKTGRKKYAKTGGWITQPFSPDDDPDGEDRYITDYSDVATWRKVVEKIDEICSDIRKDCFAVIDAPRQLTLDGAAPKLRRSKFTNNFDKTIGKAMRYITGFNTSYSAGYYNWLRTTDQYTGKSIWIPPSTKIIGNYCYLNINNLPWLAPAGLTYGLISGVHAISHNPDYQEEDQIYMKSWNYIKQYPTEGFVVEGQKTLLGKESVFERVNVRLLFLDLERFAYNVSRTFKYQVNNTYTREQFVATLRPKFEDYTIRGGIYEYLIKVDDENNTPETIDANELRGDIFIKPARLIEFILLNFVGTTTGTDFTELALG